MKPDECDGCYSYFKGNICSGMAPIAEDCIYIENVSFCPCTECLIKTMCDTPCDNFLEERLRQDETYL